MDFEIILTVLMGIALSAACGFRIFVPFLFVSIGSLSGNLTLSNSFSWIGTVPALITFSVATIMEIAGYFIPWVDNLLDTLASPVAVIAGIVLTASVIVDMSPLIKWILAIIGGGGTAATIQTLTGLTRAASTTTTGGIGNPVFSSVELGSSVSLAALAIFIPVIAGIIVILLLLWAIKTIRKRYKGFRNIKKTA
jgi:hypothetical protein